MQLRRRIIIKLHFIILRFAEWRYPSLGIGNLSSYIKEKIKNVDITLDWVSEDIFSKIDEIDRLILKITALRNQDFEMLKEVWESNFDNKNFDQEAHWERDKRLRIELEREFWFEISSFFGKNITVLDESEQN